MLPYRQQDSAITSLYMEVTANHVHTLPEVQLNVVPTSVSPQTPPEMPTATPVPPTRRGNVIRGWGIRMERGRSLTCSSILYLITF